jgi:hypothetical protein
VERIKVTQKMKKYEHKINNFGGKNKGRNLYE